MRKLFVTGIGTDVGKTVVSAILVEALQADYWKPVQTGSYFSTDSEKVRKYISNYSTTQVIHHNCRKCLYFFDFKYLKKANC